MILLKFCLKFWSFAGTEWHASIRDERNHFIFDDLPYFIMDSYEECKEPPRLQLLDRCNLQLNLLGLYLIDLVLLTHSLLFSDLTQVVPDPV